MVQRPSSTKRRRHFFCGSASSATAVCPSGSGSGPSASPLSLLSGTPRMDFPSMQASSINPKTTYATDAYNRFSEGKLPTTFTKNKAVVSQHNNCPNIVSTLPQRVSRHKCCLKLFSTKTMSQHMSPHCPNIVSTLQLATFAARDLRCFWCGSCVVHVKTLATALND